VLENFLNDSLNNLLQNGVTTVQVPIGIAANVLGAGAAALAHGSSLGRHKLIHSPVPAVPAQAPTSRFQPRVLA
jgi:hypothetical protein